MSDLRNEIERIQCPADAHAPSYLHALSDVVAIIDKQEGEPRTLFGAQLADKPSDERPARNHLAMLAATTSNPYLYAVCAVIECFDALTAAVKAGKQ